MRWSLDHGGSHSLYIEQYYDFINNMLIKEWLLWKEISIQTKESNFRKGSHNSSALEYNLHLSASDILNLNNWSIFLFIKEGEFSIAIARLVFSLLQTRVQRESADRGPGLNLTSCVVKVIS